MSVCSENREKHFADSAKEKKNFFSTLCSLVVFVWSFSLPFFFFCFSTASIASQNTHITYIRDSVGTYETLATSNFMFLFTSCFSIKSNLCEFPDKNQSGEFPSSSEWPRKIPATIFHFVVLSIRMTRATNLLGFPCWKFYPFRTYLPIDASPFSSEQIASHNKAYLLHSAQNKYDQTVNTHLEFIIGLSLADGRHKTTTM